MNKKISTALSALMLILAFTAILGCTNKDEIMKELLSDEQGKYNIHIFVGARGEDVYELGNEFTKVIDSDPEIINKIDQYSIFYKNSPNKKEKNYFKLLPTDKLPCFVVFDTKGIIYYTNEVEDLYKFNDIIKESK
ncbi:hypothetical protein [Paenibacillus sp. SAFN-117]|uniref:hypothetical protein n=1 Tax=Paenibacillus sp. SAFN-117 TaxID=3436860 RepID=UPI003F815AB1